MYELKKIPEDFIVKEINKPKISEGAYNYYLMKKTNSTTESAVSKICKALRIPRKNIGYAGIKDKRAVTEQVISIYKRKTDKIDITDITLDFLGSGKERICLGDLTGNEFIITIRNLESEINIKTLTGQVYFPNYFDEQRFSSNNVSIGRAFIKKDFKVMTSLLEEDAEFGSEISEYMDLHKNDFVGAIKKIPKKILLIYAHAYQSYLFNSALSKYLIGLDRRNHETEYSQGKLIFLYDYDGLEELYFPVIGFGTEFHDEAIEKIYNELLRDEGIALRDFIIRQFPEVALDSDDRKAILKADEFRIIETSDDELNKGKKKIIVGFKLSKGSYATMFIKSILA